MRGHSVLDFMVRTYRNNRALLKERKPLKKTYEENNLHYIRKNAQRRANEFDPEKKKIFLEKFHRRQKRIQKRLAILLSLVILLFSLISYLAFKAIF